MFCVLSSGGGGDDDVGSTECVTWNDRMVGGLGLIWGTTLEFAGGTKEVYDTPGLCSLVSHWKSELPLFRNILNEYVSVLINIFTRYIKHLYLS